MPERIQKILSSHGVASRREAELMILAGRVTVDGAPAKLGQSAEFGIDGIAVDGVPLTAKGDPVYIMLNKPLGYVTTMRDERGRKTVTSLVADAGVRVYPVGRLDINSEGLLLMTNDGHFANTVMHPSYGKTKSYEARVSGEVDEAAAMMRLPMRVDTRLIHAASVDVIKKTDGGGILKVVINEGRNRQVRKMCAMCGLKVLALKRIAIGNLTLGSLKAGRWRHLTEDERRSLME